jgi:hypothetical protein
MTMIRDVEDFLGLHRIAMGGRFARPERLQPETVSGDVRPWVRHGAAQPGGRGNRRPGLFSMPASREASGRGRVGDDAILCDDPRGARLRGSGRSPSMAVPGRRQGCREPGGDRVLQRERHPGGGRALSFHVFAGHSLSASSPRISSEDYATLPGSGRLRKSIWRSATGWMNWRQCVGLRCLQSRIQQR